MNKFKIDIIKFAFILISLFFSSVGCNTTGEYVKYNPNKDISQYDDDLYKCKMRAMEMYPSPAQTPTAQTNCSNDIDQIRCTQRTVYVSPETSYQASVRQLDINRATNGCMTRQGWEEQWIENNPTRQNSTPSRSAQERDIKSTIEHPNSRNIGAGMNKTGFSEKKRRGQFCVVDSECMGVMACKDIGQNKSRCYANYNNGVFCENSFDCAEGLTCKKQNEQSGSCQ